MCVIAITIVFNVFSTCVPISLSLFVMQIMNNYVNVYHHKV